MPAAIVPALALFAGAGIGLLLDGAGTGFLFALLGAAACGAVWSTAARRREWSVSAVATVFASGGALVAMDAWQTAWRPTLQQVFEAAADEDGRMPATLTGVLREDAFQRADFVSLSLDVQRVDDAPVRGGVLITVGGELARGMAGEWRAGRTLRMPAEIRRPSRYLNPGVADEERSLARRGTRLVGAVKSGALIEVVAAGRWAEEAAASTRIFVRRAVAAHVAPFSARSAGIVTAILIGDRSGLDEDVRRQLQEAGTYHVIAISGGNIAILAGLSFGLFRLAGFAGRSAALTAIASLAAYAWVVGDSGGASVRRATLMAIVHLAGRTIDLRGPPASGLAVAAGLLLVVNPLAAVDPAFLLTCGATAGILAALPIAQRAPYPPILRPMVMLLAASLAAEAVLMPVGAYFFSRITIAGLALNFVAVPLMAAAQIAGMAIVPAGVGAPALASAAGWVAHLAAEGLVRSAALVDVVPALAWRVAPPSSWSLVAYYAALAGCWWFVRVRATSSPKVVLPARERTWLTAAASTGMAAALWIALQPWTIFASRAGGLLRITFLDVRQGDAAIVRFPGGSTFLVDAGGTAAGSSFDVGDRVVSPVLRWLGIRRLDAMALSHGHPDHIGGALSVVREFRPRDIWEGIPVPRLAPLQDLQTAADGHGARWVNVQAGDRVRVDGVAVAVHHPGIADWERQDVRNDDSLVIELRWQDVSILLTGDVSGDVERLLLPRLARTKWRLVKVAHHGSRTSSSAAFVSELRPDVAIVSAGRGNVYGHPARDVLERYVAVGTRVFRTDQDGAITIETDGRSVNVRTFTGRSLRLP